MNSNNLESTASSNLLSLTRLTRLRTGHTLVCPSVYTSVKYYFIHNQQVFMMRYSFSLSLVCLTVFLATFGISCQSSEEEEIDPIAAEIAADKEATVLHFTVEGMHCKGCVKGITTAVNELPGIKRCYVSLWEKTAMVSTTNPDMSDAIIEAIAATGYTATVAEKPTTPSE